MMCKLYNPSMILFNCCAHFFLTALLTSSTCLFLYCFSNVGTIENFQGVEQKVIILSLTRSNPEFVENDVKKRMGVFGMPKQANVALTRSENLFIVVGNPEPMWKDPLWKQWVSSYWCQENLPTNCAN